MTGCCFIIQFWSSVDLFSILLPPIHLVVVVEVLFVVDLVVFFSFDVVVALVQAEVFLVIMPHPDCCC